MFITRTEIIAKNNHFSGNGESLLFAIDYAGEKGCVLSPAEAMEKGIQYDFKNMKSGTGNLVTKPWKFNFSPVSFEAYKKAYEKIVFHLKRGDTYQLNLTFPTALDTDLTPEEIFALSSARFKLCIPGHFTVFSPEPFIRTPGSKIISCPMKDTIDAAIPGAAQHLSAASYWNHY